MTIPPRFRALNSTASDLEDCVSEWEKLTQASSVRKFLSADKALGALAKIEERLSGSILQMMVRMVYIARTTCPSDGHVQMRTALRTEVAVTEANLRLVSPRIFSHTRKGLTWFTPVRTVSAAKSHGVPLVYLLQCRYAAGKVTASYANP
jgi:hypothetical protein